MNSPEFPDQNIERKESRNSLTAPGLEGSAGYESLPTPVKPSVSALKRRIARRRSRARTSLAFAGLFACIIGTGMVARQIVMSDQPKMATSTPETNAEQPASYDAESSSPYHARLIVPTLVPVVEISEDPSQSKLVGWSLQDIELPIDPNQLAPIDQHEINQVLFEPNARRGIEL